MAENATLFLAYSQMQNMIKWAYGEGANEQELSLPQLAFAGAGAGTITSFVLFVSPIRIPCPFPPFLLFFLTQLPLRTPVELVKCKMQVQMLIPTPTGRAAMTAANLPGPMAILTTV